MPVEPAPCGAMVRTTPTLGRSQETALRSFSVVYSDATLCSAVSWRRPIDYRLETVTTTTDFEITRLLSVCPTFSTCTDLASAPRGDLHDCDRQRASLTGCRTHFLVPTASKLFTDPMSVHCRYTFCPCLCRWIIV